MSDRKKPVPFEDQSEPELKSRLVVLKEKAARLEKKVEAGKAKEKELAILERTKKFINEVQTLLELHAEDRERWPTAFFSVDEMFNNIQPHIQRILVSLTPETDEEKRATRNEASQDEKLAYLYKPETIIRNCGVELTTREMLQSTNMEGIGSANRCIRQEPEKHLACILVHHPVCVQKPPQINKWNLNYGKHPKGTHIHQIDYMPSKKTSKRTPEWEAIEHVGMVVALHQRGLQDDCLSSQTATPLSTADERKAINWDIRIILAQMCAADLLAGERKFTETLIQSLSDLGITTQQELVRHIEEDPKQFLENIKKVQQCIGSGEFTDFHETMDRLRLIFYAAAILLDTKDIYDLKKDFRVMVTSTHNTLNAAQPYKKKVNDTILSLAEFCTLQESASANTAERFDPERRALELSVSSLHELKYLGTHTDVHTVAYRQKFEREPTLYTELATTGVRIINEHAEVIRNTSNDVVTLRRTLTGVFGQLRTEVLEKMDVNVLTDAGIQMLFLTLAQEFCEVCDTPDAQNACVYALHRDMAEQAGGKTALNALCASIAYAQRQGNRRYDTQHTPYAGTNEEVLRTIGNIVIDIGINNSEDRQMERVSKEIRKALEGEWMQRVPSIDAVLPRGLECIVLQPVGDNKFLHAILNNANRTLLAGVASLENWRPIGRNSVQYQFVVTSNPPKNIKGEFPVIGERNWELGSVNAYAAPASTHAGQTDERRGFREAAEQLYHNYYRELTIACPALRSRPKEVTLQGCYVYKDEHGLHIIGPNNIINDVLKLDTSSLSTNETREHCRACSTLGIDAMTAVRTFKSITLPTIAQLQAQLLTGEEMDMELQGPTEGGGSGGGVPSSKGEGVGGRARSAESHPARIQLLHDVLLQERIPAEFAWEAGGAAKKDGKTDFTRSRQGRYLVVNVHSEEHGDRQFIVSDNPECSYVLPGIKTPDQLQVNINHRWLRENGTTIYHRSDEQFSRSIRQAMYMKPEHILTSSAFDVEDLVAKEGERIRFEIESLTAAVNRAKPTDRQLDPSEVTASMIRKFVLSGGAEGVLTCGDTVVRHIYRDANGRKQAGEGQDAAISRVFHQVRDAIFGAQASEEE